MDMKEAMKTRHMVRNYTTKEIPTDLVAQLNDRIKMNNKKHNLTINFVTNDPDAMPVDVNLVLSKNVNNFIILSGKEGDDEKCGYAGTDLMLYATTLGLNTWWVGGIYNHKMAEERAEGVPVGIIAVGYGETQGKPHDSKDFDDVYTYEGIMPEWFRDGIEAALLAPTAKNSQAFTINGKGSKVHLDCDNGPFTGVDTGIIKYHFELGAGSNNFEWV